MKIGLVTGNFESYSNQKILDEAKSRGHEIKLIDFINCDLIINSDGSDVIYNGESLKDLDAVIPRIGVRNNFYGMAVIRQFESMGIYSLNGSLGISRARDKLRTLQILAKKKLPFPQSAISNTTTSTEKLIAELKGPPLVIKLNEGLQGMGVVMVETKQSATSVIEAFAMMKTNLILQEYVAESKGCDTRVFIIGGKISGCMKRIAKAGDFRSNLHRGGISESVKLTKREKEIALQCAKEFHLEVAGVDIIQSNNGPLILEINACPGLEGIERTTEKNIATEMIEYLEQKVAEGKLPKKKKEKNPL